MAGVNKVILIGHLGGDPETKTVGHNQRQMTKFSVATSESWKDKEGERQERTEWHNIVCWGRTGEVAAEYLQSGSRAFIEGKIQTRSWEDQDGQKQYRTEIVAHQVQMLDPRKGSDGGQQAQQAQQTQKTQKTSRHTKQQPETKTTTTGSTAEYDDDLPF